MSSAPGAGTRRWLHPLAWWAWAVALAVCTMRTADPVLLLLTVAVVCVVVESRRPAAAWSRAFGIMLGLAGLTLVVTVVLQIVLGVRVPGTTLVDLPAVPLPSWLGGLSLGGPVTAEAVYAAATTGLRLATLIVCFGAANALAHPARLLRIVPAALYEVGVAVVVALTFVPQLADSVVRVRRAGRLRGRPVTGLRGLRGLLVPVLEGALEQAIALAASMDSRGYGRRGDRSTVQRRVTAGLVLAGLFGAVAGTYQVIDPSASRTLGLTLLGVGTALAVTGALLAGRRTARTRYRPDPWRTPEWVVVGTGLLAVVVNIATVHQNIQVTPALALPHVPLLAAASLALAALPAWATPRPPGATDSAGAPAAAPRTPVGVAR